MPSPAWNTYVCVENADSTAAKATEAGGQVLMRAVRRDGGRPDGRARRPRGRDVLVWQPGETKGAVLVNEPGTWNFSELNTRDPEGAKAFYGAVFGWVVNRRPRRRRLHDVLHAGYGDFLAERDPEPARAHGDRRRARGLRGRRGWLIPIARRSDERPRTGASPSPPTTPTPRPPGAAELGGEVVVPPFDAPWVRMTVLTRSAGGAASGQQVRAAGVTSLAPSPASVSSSSSWPAPPKRPMCSCGA